MPGYYQINRSERPYMKEVMPTWGFLLSDANMKTIGGDGIPYGANMGWMKWHWAHQQGGNLGRFDGSACWRDNKIIWPSKPGWPTNAYGSFGWYDTNLD